MDMGGLWLMMTVITGAVGTAMTVYGIRQREPLSLVFGIVMGVVPMVISSGLGLLMAFLASVGLFMVIRRML